MTNDDETNDSAGGPPDRRAGDDNSTGDTTMADGPRSGAAGVANAELGTSGPPASTILTPEELARTEVTGGAGLELDRIPAEVVERQIEG